MEDKIYLHLRRGCTSRADQRHTHVDLCLYRPSARRSYDKADIGSNQLTDIPAVGIGESCRRFFSANFLIAVLLTLRGSFATMTFIELCQTDFYLSHSDSRQLLLTLRGSFASTSFADSCCNDAALSNLLSTTLSELCPPRATTLPTTGYHF